MSEVKNISTCAPQACNNCRNQSENLVWFEVEEWAYYPPVTVNVCLCSSCLLRMVKIATEGEE